MVRERLTKRQVTSSPDHLWPELLIRRFHLSPSRGTQSQIAHAQRRNISCSDEVHRRYQNDSYILGCIDGETF